MKVKFSREKRGINLSAILIITILLIMLTASSSKNFAADAKVEKQQNIESNVESIDIENVISDNISTSHRKELVTENRDIDFEIKYVENDNLPKDEQVIQQAGTKGNKIVTVVKSYEINNGKEEMKEENILNTTITSNPVEQVVEVGTSEVLGRFQVHIGDVLYTIQDAPLKETSDNNSNTVTVIGKYMDVRILGVENNFIHVTHGFYSGYIDSTLLVSEYTNPEYVEKCRLQKAITGLSFDMDVNQTSGLTLEDFKRILSNNTRDVNKIFENNAEAFYYAEIKYNVNGILLAAIGIHESAWGTSAIAKDKNNLFGYGAYDSDPYNSAFIFNEYQEGIETLAKSLAKNYLNPAGTIIYGGETATGKYYNGTTISAINQRYATDENWGNAVYNIMEGLYEKLQQ